MPGHGIHGIHGRAGHGIHGIHGEEAFRGRSRGKNGAAKETRGAVLIFAYSRFRDGRVSQRVAGVSPYSVSSASSVA
jgi:hypothetical protein